MKKTLKLTRIFPFILALTLFVSCDLDDDNPIIEAPATNLIEVAKGNAELSNLVAALDRAGLTDTFEGTTNFTIIAPNNAAFTTFLATAGFSSLEEVPVATLQELLKYHVLENSVQASLLSGLQKNYVATLADGPTTANLVLYFDATDGVRFNGAATVITPDVLASNGIIHIVDEVIALPTLETFIATDDNFKELDTAIDVVSPNSELDEALEAEGPITIFAPDVMAFESLLDTNPDWNFSSDIPEDLLISVLSHHVVSGNNLAEDIDGGQTVMSLEGDDLLFTNIGGALELTDGNGNAGIQIAVTNIQASNGVIHLIDTVLLPNTTN